jgi:hypothetical protein
VVTWNVGARKRTSKYLKGSIVSIEAKPHVRWIAGFKEQLDTRRWVVEFKEQLDTYRSGKGAVV